LIFFAPLGVGVNEENHFAKLGEVSYLKDEENIIFVKIKNVK